MSDEKFQCILKALGEAARVAVGFKLITRLVLISWKRIKRSKSEEP